MNASVFSIATGNATYRYNALGEVEVEGPEGWHVLPGYLRETDADLPVPADAAPGTQPERHILMGEPGRPVLDGAVSIATMGDPAWYVAQLLAAYPDVAPYVLSRTYTDGTLDESGELVVRRQKMARALPLGAVVVAENLVDRVWAGDPLDAPEGN
jgi:hypothetical protein